MEPEISFFFYLASVLCLVLAAVGEGWRFGARTRRGLQPLLALLPLGLAIAVVPTLWNVGEAAF